MKPYQTLCGATPLWFKRMKHTLPLSLGLMVILGGAQQAYAISPTQELNSTEVLQQSVTVSGRITDKSTGEGLVGVTVVVKGTKTRAVSGNDGKYTIKAAAGQTLTFHYIGYTKQEVRVTGSSLSVELEPADNSLNEAVVIGYGTVRKADLAGSVSVMDNKAFRDQPITQASDALQGRVAGVNVVSDGVPGGSVKIRIRGTNSINKSNDPLYVVDGMVRESGLEGINPEDIQSMQILKDASSTAIYGSRGANGVVIITTKSGHEGTSSITLDASWGISQATRLPDMMGTKEFAEGLVKWSKVNESDVREYLDGTNPGIDWVDVMFRNGLTQNYKLVFTKGTEGLQAYISGNYMKHEGVLDKSQYERYSVKTNLKADIKKWLNVTLDINASRGIGKGIGGIDQNGANPIWIAFNYSPAMNMYDENGNYNKSNHANINNNPYGIIAENQAERRRDVLNGHVDLKFNILPGLTFTTSNGIDYYNNTTYNFNSSKVYEQSSMSNNNYQRVMLQSTNNLTYNKTFNEVHHLTATGVWEATSSETRSMGISGRDLKNESVTWWNVTDATSRDASNGYSKWTLLSAVARVMYNYADRYMLTATFRADGSSRFDKNKWGYFPSVAAAWTVSKENFMKSLSEVISNLKIRASYGVIGNQDLDPYSTLSLLSSTTTYYGTSTGTTGYWEGTIAQPDLKWEKTKQFDLGFDFGFLDNRLTVSFDYFNKQTSDALIQTTSANYLGAATYWLNAAKVENKGFDVAVSAYIIQTKDWSWNTTLNGSYIKNKVKKMFTGEPIIYGDNRGSIFNGSPTIIKEGEAIGTFYGYKWAGIDEEGYDTYYAADGSTTRKPTEDDRVVLGKATPDFTLGWNNTVTYKNWSLNVFFNSSFGAKRLNALRYAMNSNIGNSPAITAAGYAEKIGKTMPNPTVEGNEYIGNSSKWVENANYFRCENITLAYDLPRSIAKVADFHFSFSIQNLFTITSYEGSDPAGFNFASSQVDSSAGIDMGTHPMPRTYTFGVRVTF